MNRPTLSFCVATLLAAVNPGAEAQTQPVRGAEVTVDIRPQPIVSALNEFAQQAGIQLLFFTDVAGDLKFSVPPLSGTYTAEEALGKLLEHSGLTFEYVNSRTVAIRRVGDSTQSRNQRPSTVAVSTMKLNDDSGSGGGQPRRAQARTEPSTAERNGLLEEVVVTATKRAENVKEIPLSIAVLTRQDIERHGYIGAQDYLRAIPGVNQIDSGSTNNAVVIRGITTSPQGENLNAGTTVGTFFDETSITGAAGRGAGGIDVRPVDIERIEVLRGPQGTAFGAASLGGAVRMIPAKPQLDRWSAKVAASYSNTSGFGSDNSMIQGVMNLPLALDKFAVRAVGYRYEDSGYYRNEAGNDPATIAWAERFGLGDHVSGFVRDDVGNMVTSGGRLAATWQPTDKLSANLTFLSQTIEQDGAPVATTGDFVQAHVPMAPATQARVGRGRSETQDTNMDLLNLVLDYDVSWGELTSVTSWIDGGSTFTNGLGLESSYAASAGPGSWSTDSDFDSFTQEVRLATRFSGPVQLLTGVFYEDIDEGYLQNTGDWPGDVSRNIYVSNPQFISSVRRQLEQRAIFGELSYSITKQLTATVGGRYFEYTKDQSVLQEGGLLGLTAGVPRVPIGGGTPVNLDSRENDSSFKANLKYMPSDGAMLYASWAEGFRLGRPDVGLTPGICDVDGDGVLDGTSMTIASSRTINSDFLEQFELGGKFTLFDRRMTIDASVYHINWDGLPIRTIARCGTVDHAYTANVGAATSDGAEFQAALALLEGLRVEFGAGYTKAQLSKDAPSLLPPAFDGDRLPGSPEVSANFAAQYEFDIGGYEAFIRADSMYAGSFYGDLQETAVTKAGGYTKVDARGGVAIDGLSIELFVRNLTNEDAYTWRGLGPEAARAPFYGYRIRPRTIGLQLSYSFE